MQLEKIKFGKDTPITVTIKYINRYPIHWHEGVTEILLPLNGSIEVISNFERDLVEEGDFIFINNKAIHSIRSEGAIVAIFYIDLNYFEKEFEFIKYMFFRSRMFYDNPMQLNTKDEKIKIEYKIEIRNLLINILYKNIKDEAIHDIEPMSNVVSELIYHMVYEFNWLLLQRNNDSFISIEKLVRYHRIVKYIDDHYYEKISLDDIVSREYIAKTYFSHYWKEISNFSFQERLNYDRTLKSEFLLFTKMSLLKISQLCGFSDVKYYYRSFKRWYGCTPREHRERCIEYSKLKTIYKELDLESSKNIFDDYVDKYYSIKCKQSNESTPSVIENYMQVRKLYDIEKTSNTTKVIKNIKINPLRNDNVFFDGDNISFNWLKMNLWINLADDLGSTLYISLDYADMGEATYLKAINEFLDESLIRYGAAIMKGWKFIINYRDLDFYRKINEVEYILLDKTGKSSIEYLFEV